MRLAMLSIVLCPVLLLAGCVTTARFTPPTGYVQVPAGDYQVKAVSARGHVIGLRTHDNTRPPGDLDFWSQAVEHQKVDIDGMKLIARDAVRSDAGLDGTLLQFELGEGQDKTAYWVAVYVNGPRIITVEAAAPAAAISEESEALKKAMRSVR